MTIEEKAKRYDEALERMKSWVRGEHPECFTEAPKAAEFIFPELKESEDERIRRNIIAALKGEGYYDCDLTNECIAWVKKQGEHKPTDKVEPKDYNSIDPHFGKPADKVEPKFHEGEWVVIKQ